MTCMSLAFCVWEWRRYTIQYIFIKQNPTPTPWMPRAVTTFCTFLIRTTNSFAEKNYAPSMSWSVDQSAPFRLFELNCFSGDFSQACSLRFLNYVSLIKLFFTFPGDTLHYDTLLQGWGTYLLSRATWILHYRWRAAKSINFILKFYHYLTMGKSDFSWLIITYLLIIELRFDAMLYYNLGNETSDAGHIKCLRGPQVPHPCFTMLLSSLRLNNMNQFWRYRC